MKCENNHQEIEYTPSDDDYSECPLCYAINERNNAEAEFDRVTDTDKKSRKRDTAYMAALVYPQIAAAAGNGTRLEDVNEAIDVSKLILSEVDRRNP